ncbi:MAG: hypothetical protein C0616_08565 [Desulfuromonas sp.]|nr:MAG: hypothetical protein C0616_08565 [Desulfuromonas sp.]
MEPTKTFRVRRSLVLPITLLVLLTVVLLIVTIVQGQPTAKSIILGVMILPLGLLCAEVWIRRIDIGATSITARKLGRRKTIEFAEVTALEAVTVRRRNYLSLSTEEDFLIISNAYLGFSDMLAALLKSVPEQSISEEVQGLVSNPMRRPTDMISSWIGVLVLLAILYLQFSGKT